jgi:FkbM family methyltransferase
MRAASYYLLPARGQKRLRVKNGPARGLIFELNPRWEHTAWEGVYEQSMQQLFVKFLKPGTIVFDVGANYGFYALLGARAGAEVFAFEPHKENSESLARHAETNGLARHIHIVSCAAYSYTGDIALELPAVEGSHGNAATRPQVSETVNTVHVPCTTLDDFIRANPEPSLVKMDVEGAESEVLKGADRLFRTFRPYLLCEIHDEQNASFAEIWLRERNYTCTWLDQESSFPRHLFASPH